MSITFLSTPGAAFTPEVAGEHGVPGRVQQAEAGGGYEEPERAEHVDQGDRGGEELRAPDAEYE